MKPTDSDLAMAWVIAQKRLTLSAKDFIEAIAEALRQERAVCTIAASPCPKCAEKDAALRKCAFLTKNLDPSAVRMIENSVQETVRRALSEKT